MERAVNYTFKREQGSMRSACELCLLMDMSPEADWVSAHIGEALAAAICRNCALEIMAAWAEDWPLAREDVVPDRMAKARAAKAAKRLAVA